MFEEERRRLVRREAHEKDSNEDGADEKDRQWNRDQFNRQREMR